MLGIGTGNFASEKYPEEKGIETRGATAGLWLVIRNHPETNVLQRVHAGQKIDYQQFGIQVSAIGSDKRGMYIKLDIDNPG